MAKPKPTKRPAMGRPARPYPNKAILAAAQPGKLPAQRRVIDLGGIGR